MESKSKSIFSSIITAHIVLGTVLILDFLLTVASGTLTPRFGEDGLTKGVFLFIIAATMDIIILSTWTSRVIKTPLSKITEGITRMIDGDFTARISFNAEREFAVIRDSFNIMAERLQAAETENLKLQQEKTRMLMDLSHDIKTPISTIQYFSKALSDGLITDEEKQHRYYNTIYAKCNRVSELIDDLFEYVRLDSNIYTLNAKKADFTEFIRRIVAEFYDEVEEKGINLELYIPEEEILIDYDEALMSRAVSNIIYNAIKHNTAGTNLRIELKQTKTEVALEVADNGTGVPSQLRDYIFEPFIRGDQSRKSDGGTGLGLAISKKIVESHGGTLELKDGKSDEKTEFNIKLNKR